MNFRPVPLPMETRFNMSTEENSVLGDPTIYRSLFGRLIYFTVIHPDIIYNVNFLSQFMYKPFTIHLQAAMRIIRYIKESLDWEFSFQQHQTFVFVHIQTLTVLSQEGQQHAGQPYDRSNSKYDDYAIMGIGTLDQIRM